MLAVLGHRLQFKLFYPVRELAQANAVPEQVGEQDRENEQAEHKSL